MSSFSAASLHASPSSSSSSPRSLFQLSGRGFRWKQKRLTFKKVQTRKSPSTWIVRSVVGNNSKSSIADNGASEPARVLLERLFAQTQKLEEHIGRDSHLPQVAELGGLNLGNLESDLQAALAALKKKEEDLLDAERNVLVDFNELNRAREELEQREEKLAAASAKQEKLEEELKQSNHVLASQARDIQDLKLRLKERDQEICDARSALTLKENEIKKFNIELVKKSEEAANAESELRSKAQLLNEANKIVEKQETEISELRKAIQEKEAELEASVMMQKINEENLKVVEANLEKQTMDWLVAQEGLKKLAGEASKSSREAKKTMKDFSRVRKLLADVKSELLSSQKALASSRKKMEDQDSLLKKQLIELEEQKRSVLSYINNLQDAKMEVESERVKHWVAEARNKELERDLSMEKDLVKELQKELDKEKSLLEHAFQEKSSLQEELDRQTAEFEETQNALKVKESELVEARLEIHQLKSAQASLHLILNEKDSELSSARKRLEQVNQEIIDLRFLMNSKDEQLTNATTTLKEKDKHVKEIQHELSDTKLQVSETENVVQQIVELTNKLVISVNDPIIDAHELSSPLLQEKTANNFHRQMKQLETELEFARESLRAKEMEVLNAQRVLTLKDEELKTVLDKLDDREKEIKRMKEEITRDSNELRQLYALTQERIGEKSVGDLAIERLQLEAAELEIEAATSALYKLTEMSRDLISIASLSIDGDYDFSELPRHSSESMMSAIGDNECLGEVKTKVAHLSALTEQLVKEAGIVG